MLWVHVHEEQQTWPLLAEKRSTAPWCELKAEPALAGKTVWVLHAQCSPRKAGILASRPNLGSTGSFITLRTGIVPEPSDSARIACADASMLAPTGNKRVTSAALKMSGAACRVSDADDASAALSASGMKSSGLAKLAATFAAAAMWSSAEAKRGTSGVSFCRSSNSISVHPMMTPWQPRAASL